MQVILTGPDQVECGIPAEFCADIECEGGGSFVVCFSGSGGNCHLVPDPDCLPETPSGCPAKFCKDLTFEGTPKPGSDHFTVTVTVRETRSGESASASKEVECVC